MDFAQTEKRFQTLQAQRDRGQIDEETFRLEVAKLLLRDQQGAFWLPDADSGEWFCNRGEGWVTADPHAEALPQVARPAMRGAEARRRRRRLLIGFVSLIGVAVLVAALLIRQRWVPTGLPTSTTSQPVEVQITIASPQDGSQVTLGQAVAIESTLSGRPNLQAVSRVEVQVNGQEIASQPVPAQIQPDQTSLPVSLPWRPAAVGEQQVVVTAFSAQDEALGSASLTLNVVQAPDDVAPEAVCSPEAAFVADVTIPPDTAFPPNARLDKVWQVRNSGTCAWGVGYELVLREGPDLGAPGAVPVPPTAAGVPADLAITFWAPTEAGAYESLWQLQAPDGQFFGPELLLRFQVEAQAEASSPPPAPANAQAVLTEDDKAVMLRWEDRSDNEDAFRIYRQDVEASIGLAPANTEQFVDTGIACGNTYRYTVVAFNAAGASPDTATAEVSLPACAATDAPPSLVLTIVPTRVVASGTFTVVFQANDDLGLASVAIRGLETGRAAIDDGRSFPCSETVCAGSWPLTSTAGISGTWTLVGTARDSTGHESTPAQATVEVRP